MSPLRCAAYARYSIDKQNPLSISDQLRKCREFAVSQGWEFLDAHTYADEAVTGATDDRAGLAALLAAAASPDRPFDVVLVDDTSRLSRKLADSLRIFEQLKFASIRVIYVSQGIDTDSEQAELLLATHGIVDSLYIRELAKKVHRGVEGRALQGLHTGGRCFGYRSVPVEDSTRRDTYGRPLITGVRLDVDESQAATVRRIFTDYAAGDSIKTIAKRFNVEGIASPAPYRGQRHPSWAPSAISVILHNERYCGIVIWNRTRKVRDPRSGRRVQRVRPQSEWKIQQAPHLRIVSEELWRGVQSRLSSVKTAFANGESAGLCTRAYSAPYLLSGFLKCGICGSKMVVVSGRGQSGRSRYGCPLKHARGICENSLHIRQDRLESEVIEGLQREVLREDVARYALSEFRRQLEERLESTRSQLTVLREERDRLKGEIGNLATVIAAGRHSPALLAELEKRERRLDEISDELLATDGRGIDARLQEIEAFVLSRLRDIQGLLTGDVPRTKAELAKHCTEITLTPEGNSYRLRGDWDLVGVRADGAGGPVRTTRARFSLPLAA
jgi:DNA invertase Pin-like site-specific DNA recombinase